MHCKVWRRVGVGSKVPSWQPKKPNIHRHHHYFCFPFCTSSYSESAQARFLRDKRLVKELENRTHLWAKLDWMHSASNFVCGWILGMDVPNTACSPAWLSQHPPPSPHSNLQALLQRHTRPMLLQPRYFTNALSIIVVNWETFSKRRGPPNENAEHENLVKKTFHYQMLVCMHSRRVSQPETPDVPNQTSSCPLTGHGDQGMELPN